MYCEFHIFKTPRIQVIKPNPKPQKLKFETLFQAQSVKTLTKGFEEVYLKNKQTNLAEILFESPPW